MQAPSSLEIEIIAALLLIASAAAVVWTFLLFRVTARQLENIGSELANLQRSIGANQQHNHSGKASRRNVHPRPEDAVSLRLDDIITQRFEELQNDLREDIAGIRNLVEKLSNQLASGTQKPLAFVAAAQQAVVSHPDSGTGRAANSFLPELLRVYHQTTEEQFKEQFTPRTAQIVSGKQSNPQLGPHAAGSFFVVGSPDGGCYCLVRPRKMDPILDKHVGCKLLFEYEGYDPDGPDRSFYIDEPATLVANADSGWSLQDRGRLRFTDQGG